MHDLTERQLESIADGLKEVNEKLRVALEAYTNAQFDPNVPKPEVKRLKDEAAKAGALAKVIEKEEKWDSLCIALQDVWTAITNFFSTFWETLCSIAEAFGINLGQVLSDAWTAIKTGVVTAWNAIKQWFSDTWTNIVTTASTAWTAFAKWIAGVWDGIKTTAATVWNAIVAFFSTTWTNISTAASTAWTNFTTWISGVWEGIPYAFLTTCKGILAHSIYKNNRLICVSVSSFVLFQIFRARRHKKRTHGFLHASGIFLNLLIRIGKRRVFRVQRRVRAERKNRVIHAVAEIVGIGHGNAPLLPQHLQTEQKMLVHRV